MKMLAVLVTVLNLIVCISIQCIWKRKLSLLTSRFTQVAYVDFE